MKHCLYLENNNQQTSLPGQVNPAGLDVKEDECVVISHVPAVLNARRVIDDAYSPPPRRLRCRPTKTVKRLMHETTKEKNKPTLPKPTTPTVTPSTGACLNSSLDFSCKIDIDILTQSKLPQGSPMPVSPIGLWQFIPQQQIKLVSYSESESDFDSFFDSGSCYLDITKEEKNDVDLNVTFTKYKI
jgi:hypothetical protein